MDVMFSSLGRFFWRAPYGYIDLSQKDSQLQEERVWEGVFINSESVIIQYLIKSPTINVVYFLKLRASIISYLLKGKAFFQIVSIVKYFT